MSSKNSPSAEKSTYTEIENQQREEGSQYVEIDNQTIGNSIYQDLSITADQEMAV